MTTDQLTNDATASQVGSIYQLYVVLQKCFELQAGQKLFVERFGDVTVSAREQVETKHYREPLTDSHENLWQTLANWLQPQFDDNFYSSLVLYTTQRLGKRCQLARWNLCNGDERSTILQGIHRTAESRYTASKGRDPSAELSLMRRVLDLSVRGKLERILAKFTICARSPDLHALYERVCAEHCKGVLESKRADFLNSLLGFIVSPDVLAATRWTITCEQFTAKVRDLTAQFCQDTKVFPAKHFRSTPSEADMRAKEDRLFVQKIRDIDYHDVISDAIRDYIAANRTLLEEFRDYSIAPERASDFERDVCRVFASMRRRALRSVAGDVVTASQTFYDDVMGSTPPDFPGLGKPETAFRNGVLHSCLDRPEGGLKWRLEK